NATAAVSTCVIATGKVGTDDVTCTVTSGIFASSNASATAQTVSATATLAGAKASNYVLTNPVTSSAKINPAPLTITPAGAKTKSYGQTFTDFTGTLAGLQNLDAVTPLYASTGAAAGAAVGSYDITVASYNFTTGSASNYSITQNTATAGLIVQQ